MHWLVCLTGIMVCNPLAVAFSGACWRAASRRPLPRVVFVLHPARSSPPFNSNSSFRGGQLRMVMTDSSVNNVDELNHRKYYSINGSGQRSMVKMETNTGHALQTDVPKKMGGTDTAPQPVEHLLAALLGCTQATAVYVGRMMQPRLLIDNIEFGVEAYRDERGALEQPIDELPSIPARLQCVSGTVKVYFKKGITVTDEQLKTLGEQTEARCPVANMMHASGCKMDIKWVVGDETGELNRLGLVGSG